MTHWHIRTFRLRQTGSIRRWVLLLALLAVAAGAGAVYLRLPAAELWEPAIKAFETQDRQHPPAPGQVVFVGSSSIRFWNTLAADMAPVPVINRGFGGAQLSDLRHYADRVIRPYRPRAVVVYAGENDLGFWWAWPGLVVDRFQALVEHLRRQDPKLPILFLAIKPSPHFANRLARQREANQRLKAYCAATPGLHFIDIAGPMLDAGGRPRPELYQDGLHLNAAGYALWREQVRPLLLAVLGISSESAGTGTVWPAASPAPSPLPAGSAPAPNAYNPRPTP